MSIGSKLAHSRKAANLTQEQLAERLGVIRDFDGGWADVEVVVNRKKPEKNEVRLIPLSAISTVTFLKEGQ